MKYLAIPPILGVSALLFAFLASGGPLPGTVTRAGDTPPGSVVVVPKEVEQAELIVKESPVPAGSFAEVSIKGVATGDMVNYKVRPKPTKQVISNGVLYFNGLAASYEVEATVINWDTRKWQVADAVVTFGQQPKPPPIIDPPITPISGYFFLILRADGPPLPSFVATMGLPAWEVLKAKGHKYKDKTVKDAEKDLSYTIPAGTTLPAVVTLIVDGTVSKVARGPVTFPTDNAGILNLPNGVK